MKTIYQTESIFTPNTSSRWGTVHSAVHIHVRGFIVKKSTQTIIPFISNIRLFRLYNSSVTLGTPVTLEGCSFRKAEFDTQIGWRWRKAKHEVTVVSRGNKRPIEFQAKNVTSPNRAIATYCRTKSVFNHEKGLVINNFGESEGGVGLVVIFNSGNSSLNLCLVWKIKGIMKRGHF